MDKEDNNDNNNNNNNIEEGVKWKLTDQLPAGHLYKQIF